VKYVKSVSQYGRFKYIVGVSSDEIIEILDDPIDENVAIYESGSEHLSHTSQVLGRLLELYFFL
jgi:hypothetical protein